MGLVAAGLVVRSARPAWSTATHSDREAHETHRELLPVYAPGWSIVTGARQLGVLAAGSVVITASPESPTATHNELVGHETETSELVPAVSISAGELQVGRVAVGSFEITAELLESATTHSAVEGQETPTVFPAVSTCAGVLQVGLAAAGSAVITAFPYSSSATQSDDATQDIETRSYPGKPGKCRGSMLVGALQLGVAAPGSVESTAFPRSSTATHSETVGQDTADSAARQSWR